jgi:hypothetical protein
MRNILDVAAWAAEMEERAKQRGRSSDASLPNNVVQLPLWPEPARGVPNGVLRSALFGAIKKGRRRYMEREHVASLEGIEILYTGQRLDQGDLDIWETVLHISRLQEMGTQCRFTAYAMLKMLGKTDTGKNRITLNARLMRLKVNGVEVKQGRFTYIGSLISEAFKDEENGEYVVILNEKLRPLFGDDQFTQIDWNVRHALDGKPLAQWLHGFYATHANPYPLKVETLHRLCGSEAVLLSDFKKDLRKALDAVAEAGAAHDQPFSSEIQDDIVHAKKQPSKSQRKHLTKKVTKNRQRIS